MLAKYRSIVSQRIPQCILTTFSTKKYTTATDNDFEAEPETNFVKLIGSVWRDTVDLLGGDKSCKVIQYCTNENGEQFPISHMVTIPKKVFESTGMDSIKKGQKVNINGYVRSIPFKTSHDKTRRAISIIPHEIQLYTDRDDPMEDVCIVLLQAHIESLIWHFDNLTAFKLRTHVAVRNDDGFTGQMKPCSHDIVVFDRIVQDYIRNNVSQYDGIFIEGYLNYSKLYTNEGTSRVSGNIVAIHIEKTS